MPAVLVVDAWRHVLSFCELAPLVACLRVDRSARAAAAAALVRHPALPLCVVGRAHRGLVSGAPFPEWLLPEARAILAGVARAVRDELIAACDDAPTLAVLLYGGAAGLAVKYAKSLRRRRPALCALLRPRLPLDTARVLDHLHADRPEPVDLAPTYEHAEWMAILDRPRHANLGDGGALFATPLARMAARHEARRCVAALFELAPETAWDVLWRSAERFGAARMLRYLGPATPRSALLHALRRFAGKSPEVEARALELLPAADLTDLEYFEVLRVLLRRDRPAAVPLAARRQKLDLGSERYELEFLRFRNPALRPSDVGCVKMWLDWHPEDCALLSREQLRELFG